MTVVAIHQPNFFPWLGFFNKIVRSDQFIFMDNVQFPKKGGTWINRVKLLTGTGEAWVTLPIDRTYHGVVPVSQMRIQTKEMARWKGKFFKTLHFTYGKHPFFEPVNELVRGCFDYDGEMLTEFNIRSIKKVMDYIGLSYNHTMQGSRLECSGSATDLLIAMTKSIDGDAYMCGGGAGGYQEDELFANKGVRLIYQDFKHPVYPQKGRTEFIAGLSVLDAMFNCPVEQLRTMLISRKLGI